jgi:uncharacterized protein DUF6689
MRRTVVCLILALVMALPAAGQIQLPGLLGNTISIPLSLAGGLTADLTLTFESVLGLNLLNLGLSARVVLPNDPTLLARLPPTASIPAGFPVLLRIEPPAAGGLTFTGIVTLDLHTHNLLYTEGTPLRLFAAPLDGPFLDITDSVGSGSYRVCGSRGGFSEFLIVSDSTPLDQVITAKFDRLDQILVADAALIAGPVRSDLAAQLATARAAAAQGDTAAAIADLDLFLETVRQHSGTDIPDVWRAARDRIDVAGLLRSGGRTLRFSLTLQQDLGS